MLGGMRMDELVRVVEREHHFGMSWRRVQVEKVGQWAFRLDQQQVSREQQCVLFEKSVACHSAVLF
jgi:hypothetical protein